MSGRAWAAFAALSVIWGIPYFFIKVALADFSPAFLAWGRVSLAAALLLPLAWHRGALRGLGAKAGAVCAFAFSELVGPFFLIAFGERFISSSLTAILMATVPLMVVLLAPILAPSTRPGPRRLIGLGLGLLGVVALLGVDVGGRPLELLGAACVLGGALGYAVGPLLIQRHLASHDPLGTVAASLSVSALALALPAALTAPSTWPSRAALIAVIVLGLACTALALVLYLFLVAEAGASRATVITYVNPVVAVLLGVSVLGEHLGAVSVGGLGLVLLGSWLATGSDT
ncbi:MAG TPA: DMT family transporter [Vicinamibacteria bacterium]|nr:DMT family transporter [Vicinamibacteria bacterium]